MIIRGKVDLFFLEKYAAKNDGVVYANECKGAVRYDKPKALGDFERKLRCCHYPCSKEYQGKRNACNFFDRNCEYIISVERPPQSWQFVEEL